MSQSTGQEKFLATVALSQYVKFVISFYIEIFIVCRWYLDPDTYNDPLSIPIKLILMGINAMVALGAIAAWLTEGDIGRISASIHLIWVTMTAVVLHIFNEHRVNDWQNFFLYRNVLQSFEMNLLVLPLAVNVGLASKKPRPKKG